MLSAILLATILLVVALLYFKKNAGHKNLPPGPLGKPIIGTIPPSNKTLEEFFVSLQNQYGDIFSVRIGSRLVVGLMRYDLMKQAFAMPQMSARPDMFTLNIFTRSRNAGIVFSNGQPWINGRRFALTHLRDLGMGRRSVMEDNIQEEARALVQDFEKNVGQPMEVANNVNVAILNVIWKMIAGERFDVTNEEMHCLTSKVEENLKLITGSMSLLDWFPWLIHLPEFLKAKYFHTARGEKNIDDIITFLDRVIKQHQDTFDPTNVRDFIDHYLVEMEAQMKDPNSTFRPDLRDLSITILDLYSAGSETTSSTIRWLILYMAVYPHVQKKVQQELDEVIPRHRFAELQDKLPYMDALIAEINRHVSLSTFAVPHATTEDVNLSGYTIPKDTIILGFLKGSHYDPKLWADPEKFIPERFLDENGKFVTKEFLIPFGTGRRACLGESVARMELKLIGAAVLQNFNIAAPEGVTLNTQHDEPDFQEGVLNFAKPYKVVMTKRI